MTVDVPDEAIVIDVSSYPPHIDLEAQKAGTFGKVAKQPIMSVLAIVSRSIDRHGDADCPATGWNGLGRR